ncbi:MAG: regulatory protein [Halieaceae bacterium]|jgi:regulatory protein
MSPRHAAMDLLGRREHSQWELQRKLNKRYTPDEAREVIDQLAEEDLQSDQRFARSYARTRVLRGHGPLRIIAELRQRGVTEENIHSALAVVLREEQWNWPALARAALERRFGTTPPDSLREKARRLRFLNQRGFGGQCDALSDLFPN